MAERFSIQSRIESFGYALRGVRALAAQHNAWIHALATFLVVAFAVGLGIGRTGWLWLVGAITLVWTAEAMNTALEHLADALHAEPHPGIARAKDVAAGAVLLAALGAAVVGFLVLGPPLLAALRGGAG